MAKKKEYTTTDFKEINKMIQDLNPYASVVDDDETMEISSWVSTGNYELNAQISGSIFGGTPEGRILLLSGDPGTGKTFIALNSVREAQTKFGSRIFWFDSEGAVDKQMLKRIGIDTSKITVIPVETVRETTQAMLKITAMASGENPMEIMFVLDSLANLTSEKEQKDLIEGNDKVDMTRQKHAKALFRTLTVPLRKKRIPLIVTTHTYASLNPYGPASVIAAGSGSQYGSSVTLMLSKKTLKKEEDQSLNSTSKEAIDKEITKTGVIITSKQEKARFTKAGIPVTIHVSFYKGMNKYVGLQKYLDWETCKIAPGKLVPEIIEQEVNGKIKKVKTGKMIFEPHTGVNAAKKWVIRDKEINAKDFWLYSKEIFTPEVLEEIDKKVKPIFEFSEYDVAGEYYSEIEEDLDEIKEISKNAKNTPDEDDDENEDEDDDFEDGDIINEFQV